MSEKVLVTGGAGFIGSHLADRLSEDYHVTILDNMSTGKMENIAPLLEKSNVELVRGSITNLDLLKEASRGVKYVFHQAAIAQVPLSIRDPLATNETNVNGTLNVLLAAKENRVARVIYAASSSAYGNPRSNPQREDMLPSPLYSYAASKLAGEYYCGVFTEVMGLPTVCLRYFNVYGQRQDPHSQYATAIISFLQRAKKGLPPVVYGDGEQTRDFVFVEDVVNANLLAARSNVTGVFNIGSGRVTTINSLARLVIEISGKETEPVYRPARAGDPRSSLADISRAESFGYAPQWSLEDGLKKTAQSLL
jgi:UDP-glucose 4-epimerase